MLPTASSIAGQVKFSDAMSSISPRCRSSSSTEQLGDLGIHVGEARGAKVVERVRRDGHRLDATPRPAQPALPRTARSAAEADTAPSRSTRGSSPVRSTTVDGMPGSSPPSTRTTCERISPGTSSTLRGFRPPWRFALVAATAPTASSTALAGARQVRNPHSDRVRTARTEPRVAPRRVREERACTAPEEAISPRPQRAHRAPECTRAAGRRTSPRSRSAGPEHDP